MRPRKVLKYTCYSIFTILCFAQCYTILKNFFHYPIVIDMYDISPNLISALPGITICNNNRLSLKKLIKKNPIIGRALGERFPDWVQTHRSLTGKKDFNSFRDEVARTFQQLNYTPQSDLDEATMNEAFALKPDTSSFIKWLGCARTWQDSVECDQLSRIDSIQDRKCTTILHKGSIKHDIINKPHLFNSTRSSAGQYSYFDAKEVVQMVLNFEPEDYADLKRQIGSRILFHSNNLVASATDLDYFVTRGYRYDFNIDRQDIKFLGKPYNSCRDYESKNIGRFERKINPRVPLHSHTCIQNCIVSNVIARNKCWPSTMPYYRNDSYDPHLSIKSCDWFREPQYFSIYREMLRVEKFEERNRKLKGQSNGTITKAHQQESSQVGVSSMVRKSRVEMRAYTKIRRFCLSQCTLSCKIAHYSVTITRSPWPSDVKLIFDRSGKERVLRHCCALLTVKYSHFHHNVQEYVPKYDWVVTVGDMGGLLAVWLGISIISIYEGIQKLIQFLARGRSLSKVHVQKVSSLIQRSISPAILNRTKNEKENKGSNDEYTKSNNK